MANETFTNFKFVIAYNGTNFHGLAPNPGVRTVVGEIEKVLLERLDLKTSMVMSGRTDAGVHAATQVLNCELTWPASKADKLRQVLNSKLSPEVVVREVSEVVTEFSARRDATSRTYNYLIDCSDAPDPFRAVNHWHVKTSLDMKEMNSAASALVGMHDFTSFCRKPKGKEPGSESLMVREVKSANWSYLPGSDKIMCFEIIGSAFCHQMVRSIVGLCVAVGSGKRPASDAADVLAAKDRNTATQIAPPHGLTLIDVEY